MYHSPFHLLQIILKILTLSILKTLEFSAIGFTFSYREPKYLCPGLSNQFWTMFTACTSESAVPHSSHQKQQQ